MRPIDRQGGFSLIETLMALLGVIAVGAIVTLTLSSSSRFVGLSVRQMSAQSALRAGLDMMGSEIQWADQTTLVLSQANGSSRIDFKKPVGVVDGTSQLSTTVTYQVNPSTLDANGNGVQDEGMIVRIQNGNTTVVCQNVQTGGLVMTRNGDQLSINVTVIMPNGNTGGVTQQTGATTIQLKNGG